ncbi:MAG TPA: hypothetical protein VEP89_09430 [Draconibacterium sp.]|nr:hypothetical protein [Draconibacterium sp.]
MVPKDDKRGEEYAFFSQMKELLTLYESTKKYIFLSEYYNKNHKVSVSVINELRNSFDHVMRAVKYADLSEGEFSKARGHLYRSAFDACEIIVINRLNYIYSFKKDYELKSLQSAFPKYHSEYLPLISSIIEDLSKVRNEAKSKERLAKYEEVLTELIEICNELDKGVGNIIEVKKSDIKKNGIIKKVTTISIGAVALITSIISVAFGDSFKNSNMLIMALVVVIVSLVYVIFKNDKVNS